MTDEERIRIALDRFRPLRDGEALTSLKVLQAEYKRDPAVLSRAVVGAFQKGLVEIREVQRLPEETRRVQDVEESLLERFGRLRGAIVADGPVESIGGLDGSRAGDTLHATLGRALAKVISTGSLFRDNDVIGLGSGRGVHSTVDWLRRSARLRASNVTLMSLTGAVYARSHSYWNDALDDGSNSILDADLHVHEFGPCFARRVNLSLISHPIACMQSDLKRVIARTSLDEDEWRSRTPTHALIGVGVLADGHAFYQKSKARENRDRLLDPIDEYLKPLVTICDAIASQTYGSYCPVGDMCNRLFYIPPPPGVDIGRSVERQIRMLILRINERLVTASEQQLRDIDTIIMIAGTRKKARAIRVLLDDEGFKIRFICTDRGAAQEILA